jgi:beta-xylosidase
MIDTVGPIVAVPNLPRYTEAPWIHKYKDWYYLSYASEFPEKTVYAMSKNITGPWEYKGIINELAGNCNTNHQAIVEFKGNWYFIYHNGGANVGGSNFHRSVCIDRLYYNEDGTIKRVQMTTEGTSAEK